MAKVKLKTHRGAKKRFKVTATGKVMIKGAGARHILTKKSRKSKRQKRKKMIIKTSDLKALRKAMPYSF